jgi:hypothetical protein
LSPFDATIFLDADTLVVGSIDELWPLSDELVLTMFADWVSTGTRMQQRIKPWAVADAAKAGYTPDAQQIERVRVMLSKKWPAINTGVMAWSRSANCQAFAAEWHRVTNMRDTFIVDETACQIIFPEFQTRVLDDRFNASVVYPPAGKTVLGRDDVRIYHGHGGKFWKRDGSGKVRPGQLIYVPHYERALQENLGCIRAIAPYAKWFRQLDDDVRARLEGYLTAPV